MFARIVSPHQIGSILLRVLAISAVLLATAVWWVTFSPSYAQAQPIYVSAIGSDTSGDGSLANPFASIQHAIDKGSPGDDVYVGVGTFVGDVTLKDGVSLRGAGASSTVLVGSGTTSVVTANSIGATTTIADLELMGGGGDNGAGISCVGSSLVVTGDVIASNQADQRGGGVYIDSGAPVFSGCSINSNSAGGAGGGGIFCVSAAPVFDDCTISSNYAATSIGIGGGIYFDSSSPWLSHCELNGNISGNAGGGIACFSTSVVLADCAITQNSSSGYGGGIYTPGSSSVIASCTINGNTAVKGGGIYTFGTGSVVTSCTISGNRTSGGGAGIACDNSSSPTIMKCVISGNTAGGYGGGINLWSYSSPIISDCTIENNAQNQGVGEGGGGIDCNFFCSPVITNSTIASNTAAGEGGGVYARYFSTPTITNCTITRNRAASGSGYSVWAESNATPSITNCIIWQNGHELSGCSATYTDVEGDPSAGNIDADPHFLDAAHSNYHLAADSPCIDAAQSAGAPSTDKDGLARPFGTGFDMGAYEAMKYAITPVGSAGGSISPNTTMSVLSRADATFTVQPFSGYHIADEQIDGRAIGASTTVIFRDVSVDHTLTVTFALDTHSLHYAAGVGGSIIGSNAQIVDFGSAGSAVTASAMAGYHFVRWSDGRTDNPRSDMNVQADVSVTAEFALTTYASRTTTKLNGASSVRLRRRYKLSGAVSPSAASGNVIIAISHRVRRSYKRVSTVRVKISQGKFHCVFMPNRRGRWHLAASYSGGVIGVTTYKTSRSATKTIIVK